MKYRYMTRLFVAGALMAAFAFAGCSKDDDRIDLPTNPDSQQMNLSSLADFYEITLPGNKGWAVESAPEWTTPADSVGAAGTKLSLFVRPFHDFCVHNTDAYPFDRFTGFVNNPTRYVAFLSRYVQTPQNAQT